MEISFIKCEFDSISLEDLKNLYDLSYPSPPRDVFTQIISEHSKNQKFWLALKNNQIIGSVMLAPYSKGGHLENLAVLPNYRKKGIGTKLIKKLLIDSYQNNLKLISLTTRIPEYFSNIGFKESIGLQDGSTYMIFILDKFSEANKL